MVTKTHQSWRLATLFALCLALSWQSVAAAAPRYDLPRVMGPDAEDLSRHKTSNGPLIMYIGGQPYQRPVRQRTSRQARRNVRHGRARFADADAR